MCTCSLDSHHYIGAFLTLQYFEIVLTDCMYPVERVSNLKLMIPLDGPVVLFGLTQILRWHTGKSLGASRERSSSIQLEETFSIYD